MTLDGTIRPRVLFASPVPDFKGGAEIVLRAMLDNPHIDPVLAVPVEGPLSEEAAGKRIPVCYYRPRALLQVHRPPRPLPIAAAAFDAVRCAIRLRRLARMYGCGILHSNGMKTHLLSAIIGRLPGLHTLVHMHDIPYRRTEQVIWRSIMASVSQVVLVSRPCYPGTVLPNNVQIVRNGIANLCPKLPVGWEGGPVRLGFVGRFHPNKGLDRLVDWFAAVREHGIDATLIIRGRPDPDNPGYWNGILQRFERMGLAPFVVQDGWKQGAETYAGLDVLLVPSDVPDPAPLVVPEAMGAGVIVAAFPAGGIPAMTDNGRTGLLVDAPVALAERLKGLLGDRQQFTALRQAGFDWARAEFDLDRFHHTLADIYQSMLKTRQAPADTH